MGIQVSNRGAARAVAVRGRPDHDLIHGIVEACAASGIRAGRVSCCIGGLRNVSFMRLVPSDNKRGGIYCDPVTVEGPLEILSVQGGRGGKGRWHPQCPFRLRPGTGDEGSYARPRADTNRET